jgi:hypothetical protein
MVEKAMAKHFGSYHRLDGGNPAHAMFDITGQPVEEYTID